jgi:hypothetical protein
MRIVECQRELLLLYIISSPGLERRTFLGGLWPLSSNLVAKQIWSWRRYYVVSFQATKSTITGTRIQNSEILHFPKLFLFSKHKYTKFGVNSFIRSRATNDHTHTHTHKVFGEQYRLWCSASCCFLRLLALNPSEVQIFFSALLLKCIQPVPSPQRMRPSFTPIQNNKNYNSVCFNLYATSL